MGGRREGGGREGGREGGEDIAHYQMSSFTHNASLVGHLPLLALRFQVCEYPAHLHTHKHVHKHARYY